LKSTETRNLQMRMHPSGEISAISAR